jgi:hypothetical protein
MASELPQISIKIKKKPDKKDNDLPNDTIDSNESSDIDFKNISIENNNSSNTSENQMNIINNNPDNPENINISIICDFKSEKFYNLLYKAINERIIKYYKGEKYWKYDDGKWERCSKNDGIEFVKDKFERYLNNIIFDDNVSSDEKRKIKNRIGILRKGDIDFKLIFDELMKLLSKGDDFFVEKNIDGTREEQKRNLNIDLSSLTVDQIIQTFVDDKIVMTGSNKDRLKSSEIYNKFKEWLSADYDTNITGTKFGSILKTILKTYKRGDNYRYYSNVMFK